LQLGGLRDLPPSPSARVDTPRGVKNTDLIFVLLKDFNVENSWFILNKLLSQKNKKKGRVLCAPDPLSFLGVFLQPVAA
jgi:hypothetical protein